MVMAYASFRTPTTQNAEGTGSSGLLRIERIDLRQAAPLWRRPGLREARAPRRLRPGRPRPLACCSPSRLNFRTNSGGDGVVKKEATDEADKVAEARVQGEGLSDITNLAV
jgi:hypothetical protein